MKRLLTALGVSALILVLAGWAVAAPGASQAPPVTPIRHVVVLYLENHSFDNVLGYWCNSHPGRCPGGGMPAAVTLSNGTVVIPGIAPDKVPDIGHAVRGQRAAINGGKMNGWQNVTGCDASTRYACISGYKPARFPTRPPSRSGSPSATAPFPWPTAPPGAATCTWPSARWTASGATIPATGRQPQHPRPRPRPRVGL